MPNCNLDHLIVTAPSLDQGEAWVRDNLGVAMQPGGEHVAMGTHNRLLKIGPQVYLEVIAVNPNSDRPNRPPWFGLDALHPGEPSRLAGWALASTDIATSLDRASEPLGEVLAMSRGAFRWRISVPADGSLPLAGVGPALIEWQAGGHPTKNLADAGILLTQLELRHPQPKRVERLLCSLSQVTPVTITVTGGAEAALVARFDTPDGPRQLGSR